VTAKVPASINKVKEYSVQHKCVRCREVVFTPLSFIKFLDVLYVLIEFGHKFGYKLWFSTVIAKVMLGNLFSR
jgi:hypothetical protein